MKNLIRSLLVTALTTSSFAVLAQNYRLEKSADILQKCEFIHTDEFSFNDELTMIQELLRTKFEGDKACSAPLAQLNAQLVELDKFYNSQISEKEKKELVKSAQSNYLLDLQSELTLLDPTVEANASRILALQTIIDTLKQSITTLGVESQLAALEDEKNKKTELADRWEKVYATSTDALKTLNALPDNCVDKVGGWKNLVPVVMKLASSAGPLVGGAAGGIIGAGFEAGAQVAILMRNNRTKRAISETYRVENAQILACTYSLIQSNACELKRAKKLADDKKKILDLINQRVTDTKNAEYEAYFLQLSRLSKIKDIFKSVGSIGSALTLDLQLTSRFIAALRLDPTNIKDIPGPGADNMTITNFLINMKARGLEWQDWGQNGPIPLKDQLEQVKTQIESAIGLIDTVKNIMIEKRSFLNLKGDLIKQNQYAIEQLKALQNFTVNYLNSPTLPKQYRADFKNNQIVLKKLLKFLDHEYLAGADDDEAFEIYLKDVNDNGMSFFSEIARGSVAQISAQTVLMIPEIAFESFNRPFKHLEKHYITQDIIRKDDPTHPSYTDFVINRSMQSKFSTYPAFFGSSAAFRDDTYEAAKNGIEQGFKREITRFIKDSMKLSENSRNPSPLDDFKGATPAHMCALFAPFLMEEAPALFRSCQEKYKKLGLLPILSEVNRPTEMKINYEDPCFYNSYKQEQAGQRRLFEKLIDYGNRNNLTLAQ